MAKAQTVMFALREMGCRQGRKSMIKKKCVMIAGYQVARSNYILSRGFQFLLSLKACFLLNSDPLRPALQVSIM
jgi:hypothetical protein